MVLANASALPITSGIKKGFSLSESRELLNEADHDPSNEENIFLPLLRIEAVLATTDNDTSSILRALNGLRHCKIHGHLRKIFLLTTQYSTIFPGKIFFDRSSCRCHCKFRSGASIRTHIYSFKRRPQRIF